MIRELCSFTIGEEFAQMRSIPVAMGVGREGATLFVHSQNPNIDPWSEAFNYARDTLKMTLISDSGKVLWRRDLGWGLVPGIWYSPVLSFDLDGDGVPLWFSQMRFEKPVCMGHIGYARVALVPEGLYSLDTGAVRGGQLTAVVFPGGDIVQVPVPRNYHDEAYKAWRAAQRTLVGDPQSWTLAQALKVLDGSDGDRSDWANEIGVLDETISALGIEERGRRLQAQLRERFGNMPPPGPARGEYFKTVKNALPDWGSRNLAARLLKDAPITFQDLAVAFPDTKVRDMATLADSMEDHLLCAPAPQRENPLTSP